MWIPFCYPQYSDETLAVFKSYKLDDMQASKRKLEELRASGGEHVYFAKFLTSEKVGKLFFTSSNHFILLWDSLKAVWSITLNLLYNELLKQ